MRKRSSWSPGQGDKEFDFDDLGDSGMDSFEEAVENGILTVRYLLQRSSLFGFFLTL